MAAKKKKSKPGPEADRLKIDGDWKEAVRKAIEKARPVGGWPSPSSRSQASSKSAAKRPS